MNLDRLAVMVKHANLNDGLELLPKLKSTFPESSTFKIPEVPKPKMAKPPELPKLQKIKPLKLDTGSGKSKPAFTHDFKDNSPYNEK